ncbi:hypothetical protein KIL84_019347 [Mauremys mutica]|uniref:Uncharacterized protein n=1 Tax=Mauremys mutica TaxID=74926 RepID=A0A9D4B9Y2_9SAUR|nr:hypothetical protein KIL84_019347 [Mauremys mutica]
MMASASAQISTGCGPCVLCSPGCDRRAAEARAGGDSAMETGLVTWLETGFQGAEQGFTSGSENVVRSLEIKGFASRRAKRLVRVPESRQAGESLLHPVRKPTFSHETFQSDFIYCGSEWLVPADGSRTQTTVPFPSNMNGSETPLWEAVPLGKRASPGICRFSVLNKAVLFGSRKRLPGAF